MHRQFHRVGTARVLTAALEHRHGCICNKVRLQRRCLRNLFPLFFPASLGGPRVLGLSDCVDQHCPLVGKMSPETGTMSHCWDEENIVPLRG
jgi:hypothetical protein